MASSSSSVTMLGMGPQSAGLIITLGFGTGGQVVSTTDTHDGFRDEATSKAIKKRDQEFREARIRLRTQLLQAVEKVTGKPPPLDASLKQLASIARKSESFDYKAMLEEIKGIEARQHDDALSQAESIRARETTRKRLELEKLIADGNEEAMMLLLATL